MHGSTGLTLFMPNSMRNMPAPARDLVHALSRDMFITQPPCSNVNVTICGCIDIGVRYARERLHNADFQRADGIKLGDLYDIFHSRLTGNFNQFFIELTFRDWVSREFVRDGYCVGDRVKWDVDNGELRRHDSLEPPIPDLLDHDSEVDSDSLDDEPSFLDDADPDEDDPDDH